MLSSNLSDQELVKKYINGDNYSFEVLLNRHKNRVFAFIMSKIKNKDLSEDIFQDTYVKVVNSLQKGKYNEEGKFLPWVMRIAHNLVIDHFRKQKKMHMVRSNNDFDISINTALGRMRYALINLRVLKKKRHVDLHK